MPLRPIWHHRSLAAHLQALDQSVGQLNSLVGGRHLFLTTDFLAGRLLKLIGEILQGAVKVLQRSRAEQK